MQERDGGTQGASNRNMSKPRCATCIYFSARAGECRYETPSDSGWPRVTASDWCGYWTNGEGTEFEAAVVLGAFSDKENEDEDEAHETRSGS